LRALAVALIAGAAVVLASAVVVYSYYPQTAVAAAEAGGGRAPFEAAVAAVSGWRSTSAAGILVDVKPWRGHCLALLDTRFGRVVVVLPRWAHWALPTGARVDPCRILAGARGGHVRVWGVEHPGPHGPVIVAYRVEAPNAPPLTGSTPVPPGPHPHQGPRHRGWWG